MKRPVRGFILDVDGTLVDSNPAHARAWFEALRNNGFDPGMATIRAHIGMNAARLIAGVLGIPEPSTHGRPIVPEIIPKIINDKREIFRAKYLPTIRPFRCADALVAALMRDGLRAVIANVSGTDESELDPLVRLVGPATCSVPRIKQAAEPIALALDRLGLYPVEVFMIGGSPFDIEAALRLSIRTIAFRSGGFPADKLEAAAALYDDPQSLLENFETSPLASSLLARPA